jgi:hypothetical protein
LIRKIGFSPSGLLSDGPDEIGYRCVTGSVLVKGAIRADAVAKGDVDVKEHEVSNFKFQPSRKNASASL